MSTRGRAVAAFVLALVMASAAFAPPAGAVTIVAVADPATVGPIPQPLGPSCGDFSEEPQLVLLDVAGVSKPIHHIELALTMSHPWVGDLVVELVAPGDQASLTVFSRTGTEDDPLGCGDGSDLEGTYRFSDASPASPTFWEAAAAVGDDENVPAGEYRTSTPGGVAGGGVNTSMSAFHSVDANGTWTVRLWDGAADDEGSIGDARLSIVQEAPDLVVGASPDLERRCARGVCRLTGLQIDNIGPADHVRKRAVRNRPLIEVYRSAADLDAGKRWGAARLSKPIPAGGSVTVGVPVKTGAPPSEVIVVIDRTGKADEIDEDNNQATLSL